MRNDKDIIKFLDKALNHVMQCVTEALTELITEADAKARERSFEDSFNNISGNLRSSVGGAVARNGRVVFTTAFEQVLNGAEGSRKGRQMVETLASRYSDAVTAVMAAGMDYAEKVEALDSKDVLESTRLWAEGEAGKRIKAAMDRAAKEIDSWHV